MKRNPFKKTPQSVNKTVNNPLKHLTDNAIGYDSSDANNTASDSHFTSTNGSENVANGKENSSSENTQLNPATPKPPFIVWHQEHKAELQAEKPDLLPAELTKYSMSKYKAIYIVNGNGDSNRGSDTPKSDVPAKRKITLDESNGQSGIAKLAKFNFSK